MTYDLDGNLTGDGSWSYTYDAENRLKQIQTSANALSAGHPQVIFGYTYDYLGRRIRAVGSTWSGTGWVDHRFTYQGLKRGHALPFTLTGRVRRPD